MLLKCKRCGYSWEYRGKLGFATCPNCLRKVETNFFFRKEKVLPKETKIEKGGK